MTPLKRKEESSVKHLSQVETLNVCITAHFSNSKDFTGFSSLFMNINENKGLYAQVHFT